MTNSYLTNITPDSISGLIFGFEGIKNTVVLMNGPTGCKFYHSATADNQTLRQMEFDPLNYPELWYFGQPRVPCTYLDKRDYVYGSKEKLAEAINFLKSHLTFELLVIVNSPGAALIGDDLQRIAEEEIKGIPVITVETPGYSRTVWEGYSNACSQVIQQLALTDGRKNPSSEKTKRVNLLGLSIFQKYYQGDCLELANLLKLCGIEVNCVLCCDCTKDQITHLCDADLNLVVDPVYGIETARFLQKKHHMPYLASSGLPIGFRATEEFMEQICDFLKCDFSVFLVESEKARARAYIYLSRLNSLTGLPKGAKFAIHGTSAQCYGYARFLIQYFGLVPDSISVLDEGEDYQALCLLLEKSGMRQALDKDILQTDAQLVFADGNIIAKLKALHHEFSGIEIELPSLGYTDVIPKTHLGISGSLLLCEQIINGLVF